MVGVDLLEQHPAPRAHLIVRVDVAVGVVRDPLYVFGVRELRHDGGKLLAAHVLTREHLQPVRLEVGILDDALALFVKPLHCHAQLRLREAFAELLCNCLDLLRTDRSALVLNPYHKRSVCSCRGGGGRGRGTLSKMPNARFKSSADVCSAIVRCPRGGSGHCPALREWPLLHAHLVGVLWGPRWLYPVLLRWLVAAVGALGLELQTRYVAEDFMITVDSRLTTALSRMIHVGALPGRQRKDKGGLVGWQPRTSSANPPCASPRAPIVLHLSAPKRGQTVVCYTVVLYSSGVSTFALLARKSVNSW